MARHFTSHPDFDDLLRRASVLAVHRIVAVRTLVFRCAEPAYATEGDLLTGEGSRKFGGRWNPPASFATVYAGFEDATALAESKATHLYYGLDPADAMPRTIVAIDVTLKCVLDITDGAVRKSLKVSATTMRAEDWRALNRKHAESITQAIGGAAYQSGLEGLIVPACDGGENLIWFPGNMIAPSKAIIRNVDKLGW